MSSLLRNWYMTSSTLQILPHLPVFGSFMSSAYFLLSPKPLIMFNLFLPFAGFPIILPFSRSFRKPSYLRTYQSQLRFSYQMVSKRRLVSFLYSMQCIYICHHILAANSLHSSPNPQFKGFKHLSVS